VDKSSFWARPISLSLRRYGNLFVGEIAFSVDRALSARVQTIVGVGGWALLSRSSAGVSLGGVSPDGDNAA